MWRSGRTLACLLFGSFLAQGVAVRAADGLASPAVKVGRADGTLAVAANLDGPWRVIEPPEALPERCWLRSAPYGTGRLEFPGATIRVAPNSRLEIAAHKALIRLIDGRLAWEGVESADDVAARQTYSIEIANRLVQIKPGAAAELLADNAGGATLYLSRGAASVAGQTFDAATAVRWRAGEAPPEAAPPSEADGARLAAWAVPSYKEPGGPRLGQLLVRSPRTDTVERLRIVRCSIHVVLRPPLAMVQIDQAFFNPSAGEREGAFVIDLPPDAAVSRFAMSGTNGRLTEAELVGRPRAVEIHNTISRGRPKPKAFEPVGDNLFQMLDEAGLEEQRRKKAFTQVGDNLFQMQVSPVAGRTLKRVLLDYTLPLKADGSRYHFHLPLASDTEPTLDFHLTGEIHPFGGQVASDDVTSASHPDLVCHDQPDGTVAFALANHERQSPAEFAISFPAARDRPPVAVRSYRARSRTGNASDADIYYFLAQINRRGQMAPTAPADVLILADTSSGITEPDTVRRVTASIIKNLRREDRFQLGCVDVAYRPLTKGWTAPGSPGASAACAAIDRQIFLGETELIGCFQQALENAYASDEGRRRVVIYIGDGANTVGMPAPAALGQRLDEALKSAGASLAVYLTPLTLSPDSLRSMDIFAQLAAADGGARAAVYAWYGGKSPVNFLRLAPLAPVARDSGGLLFDGRHPAQASGELFQWLLSGLPTRPRLNKIELEGESPEDFYYLPDAVGDGSLELIGRTTNAGRAKLTLSLAEGREQAVEEYEITIDPRDDDPLVGRLWAQCRVDELAAKSPTEQSPELTELVYLSQEWSLLSPYTAFLLLENESDYILRQIDPRRRRRYWQPTQALPPFAAPADWLRSPEESPADKHAQAEHFAKLLAPARESLDHADYWAAWSRLEALRRFSPAEASSEFAELSKRALTGLRRAALVDHLGMHRRLIDPQANLDSLQRSFEPGRLLWPRSSPEFLRIQPHADRWLEEVEVSAESLTLAQWAKLLGDRSGVNVVLDRKALGEIGNDESTRLQVVGHGRLSLRSLLRHAFRRAEIAVVDEPHRFLITSRAGAENHLPTHVYPVADLLTPGELADWGQLANPYLDREEAARRRISARLAQPVSLSYTETPLRKVIEQFAARLKAAVVIDVEAIEEARNDLTATITGAWGDAPLGDALRWTLDDLDLTYTIRDEALLITSKAEAEGLLRVGLHSGVGLLRDYLAALGPDGQPQRNDGMGMGGGGMFNIDSEPTPLVGLGFAPERRYSASVLAAAQTVLTGQPFATRRLLGDEPQAKPDAVFVPDERTMTDMVTSTIEPTSWDEVGGPGTMRLFDPTLDFVIGATDDVHERIERLFTSLRKLPPVAPHLQGHENRERIFRLAEMPTSHKGILPPDLKSFIDLITSCVEPRAWDEVGGPGAIREDLPRLALVVSQNQDVHCEIIRLLTLLRRSRYAATHDDRPWEADFLNGVPFDELVAAGRPTAEQRTAEQRTAEQRTAEQRTAEQTPAEQPPVDRAALAALAAVRRDPREGSWRWEYSRRGATAESIALRRQAGRMELALGEQSLRIDGADAAVVYPGLVLAKIGRWADAARKLADGCLPWLMHRTNEELARMFTIEALPATEKDKQARQSRIRLYFPGLDDRGGLHNGERTYIEAAFAHDHRLPTAWEAFVGGELTLRLQFKDLIDSGGQIGMAPDDSRRRQWRGNRRLAFGRRRER